MVSSGTRTCIPVRRVARPADHPVICAVDCPSLTKRTWKGNVSPRKFYSGHGEREHASMARPDTLGGVENAQFTKVYGVRRTVVDQSSQSTNAAQKRCSRMRASCQYHASIQQSAVVDAGIMHVRLQTNPGRGRRQGRMEAKARSRFPSIPQFPLPASGSSRDVPVVIY